MKKLLIVLVIIAGLLTAADFGAAAAAEYQVSKRLRDELGLSDDPAVRVNGFPFVFQAMAGDYRDVDVQAQGVQVGELQDVHIEATLRHVRVPFSDIVGGTLQEVRVDEVVGQVRLTASDIGRLINIPDLQIEPYTGDLLDPLADEDAGVDGEGDEEAVDDETTATVQLTGSQDIGGDRVQITVVGTLSLTDGIIDIRPEQLEVDPGTGSLELPPEIQQAALATFSTTIDPGGLPLDVTPTSVRAEHGALVVGGTARDVVIRN
ncbi:LmeA family phospholipid-binding protein [Actinoalloteichus hymeniacidonis]|uniref:DUF2993 family protein n=1 Tax=Actinoalloteichus hymeniacidonis TaxID=340345 RepID=A0AAC9MZZ5_9PSEU|nr:DUF2993 domain-containing protein [Actinoalloteichus hymeniacidonis]AOS65953.1 putative DUF2993 family protein [Actinoalloteichus hymeniacidonis]MBB5905951.1 hypothetical protein [Actinoalloteichus hymeniacidonis]